MTEGKEKIEIVIDPYVISSFFGKLDENVKFLKSNYDVKIKLHEENLEVSGDTENVKEVKDIIEDMLVVLEKQKTIAPKDIEYIICEKKKNPEADITRPFDQTILYSASGKVVRPKTMGQSKYIETISKNYVTFGVGPAGTGKTYLAVAMAVKAFKEKSVQKIILTRPAVEAGENLGFLPGDLQMKVDPYLRPLYDAIFDMLGAEVFYSLMEKNIIEVAPLAYMRGRTLDNAFIILDEAQNTTKEQMKMFLTRLGQGSKAIVNGDITQIDLRRDQKSGLKHAMEILDDVKGVEFVNLDRSDIVRHSVVQRIIDAYEKADKKKDE